ncbi:MAG: WGR domain-containing protein [Alphaproteobacteria bacterium]|nr:WGR domain-containing protein [Alphaproteobacteria bacterium]
MLDCRPGLFGGTTLVREWGWIGQNDTVMRQRFTDEASAEWGVDRIAGSKIRGGYRHPGLQDRYLVQPETRAAAPHPCAKRAADGGLGPRRREIRQPFHRAMRTPQGSADHQAPAACRGWFRSVPSRSTRRSETRRRPCEPPTPGLRYTASAGTRASPSSPPRVHSTSATGSTPRPSVEGGTSPLPASE